MKRIDALAKKLYKDVLSEYNAQGEGADRKALGEMLDEKLSGYNEVTKEIIEGKVFDIVGGESAFRSLPPEVLGPFKNLCQSGKITNTQGKTDEYRNRCRAICS